MVGIGRKDGKQAMIGHPVAGPDSIKIGCPKCDAEPGEKCRSWKVFGGERQYIQKHTRTLHRERTAAARRRRQEDAP